MNAAIEVILPVLSSQAGVLFDSDRAASSGVYTQQFVRRFAVAPDLPAFQRAWELTLARHPALRAAFVSKANGEYVQAVLPGVSMPWTVQPCRGAVNEWLPAWLATDRQRPFNLQRPPLMRAYLALHEDDGATFVWTVHHALLDGWSSEIVLRDVFAFYAGLAAGATAPSAAQDYDLDDFVRVVAEAAADSSAGAAEFWAPLLASHDPSPHLPRIGHRQGSPGIDELDAGIARSDWLRFQELCRERRLTVNAGIQAAWALVLARFSGRADVSYGLTVAGRRMGRIEGQVVGMFVSTIPVFQQLAGDDSFSDVARNISEHIAAAGRFPRFGLAEIKSTVGLPPSAELFDTALVFEDVYGDRGASGPARDDERFLGQTAFPLTIVVQARADLRFRLIANRDTFDRDTMAAVAEEFARTLTLLAERVEASVAVLAYASAARTSFPIPNGDDSEPSREGGSIARLFDDVVAAGPDRRAISSGPSGWTYGQLARMVARRAHSLAKAGIAREGLVAIAFCDRLEAIVSMLAANRLGAAYLPLDLGDPPDRLAAVLAESGRPLILCEAANVDRVRLLGRHLVVHRNLDADCESVAPAELGPQATLYVMFTSGSTGTPKGVVIPEAAVLRLVRAPNYVELGPGHVVAQFASLAFDASTFEIFGSLLSGAGLALLDVAKSLEIGGLAAEIARNNITTMFVTTALLNAQARTDPSAFGGLSQLLFGGERADPGSVAAIFRSEKPPARVTHVYGPTEATVFSLFHRVEPPGGDGDLPLGRPVSGATVRVLDAFGAATPPEGVGELIIGGSGLARGYLRADLTEAAFRTLPEDGDGRRWYFTGDFVRRSGDGQVFFAGRRDRQVKVRGHRVELEEVAARIRNLACVAECSVEVDRHDSELCAAVVPFDAAADPAPIRHAVREALPSYMVPRLMLFVDALPRDRNGKLDRRALRRLWDGAAPAAEPRPAPLAPTGTGPDGRLEQIAEIWEQLLGRRIDPTENFFDAGANSLLIVRAANMIRTKLEIVVKVGDLFEFPNLHALTEFIKSKDAQLRCAALDSVGATE